MAAIEGTLRRLERERAQRIKAMKHETAPPPPSHQDEGVSSWGGVPLQGRTRGAKWLSGRMKALRKEKVDGAQKGSDPIQG
jgi:hypothetical protein